MGKGHGIGRAIRHFEWLLHLQSQGKAPWGRGWVLYLKNTCLGPEGVPCMEVPLYQFVSRKIRAFSSTLVSILHVCYITSRRFKVPNTIFFMISYYYYNYGLVL